MRGVLAMALVVGLAACGGGDDMEEPRALGERVVQALCEREVRCGVYAGAAACERESRQRGWDTWLGLGTRYDAALESGRLSFDEDAAERCLAAIRDADCRLLSPSSTAHQWGIENDPACRVLRAEEPEGACQLQAECGERAYCHFATTGNCEGTCQPRSGEGEAAFRPEQCAPGLSLSHATGRCLRPATEGDVCFAAGGGPLPRNGPCGPGLWCNHASGKCQRTGAEGDACVDAFTSPCGASFVCQEGRCVRRVGKGEVCRVPETPPGLYANVCQGELFCDAEPEQSGTCQERRGEGGACRNPFDCTADLDCLGLSPQSGATGVCGKRPRPGEACEPVPGTTISNCGLGFGCDGETRTCAPYVRTGERCGAEGLCGDGSRCMEGVCIPFELFICR
jgi:hypothetical protein